jgi:hypothetical protein
VPGEFEYVSETEAWELLLGVPSPGPIPFGLEEFFTYTGSALHKTRRVSRGALTVVICLPWQEWNEPPRVPGPTGKRAKSGAKTTVEKPRKTAGNTRALQRQRDSVGGQTRTVQQDPGANGDSSPLWSVEIAEILKAEAEQRLRVPTFSDEKEAALDGLLDVLVDRDPNTRKVLSLMADGIPVPSLDVLREEILARGPEIRRPAAYAVGALQRIARKRAEAARA